MSEFENRENERNAANQGTAEEQIEKYTNKWLALWKECQMKGRDSDDMISTPGAIPLQKWQNYLKDRVGTIDMYEVEAVLQMMEELSVNGDTHKALEIFDELQVSTTDLDRICHDVMEYKPTIPMQAPDKDQRNNAVLEFSMRANESAHSERVSISKEDSSWLTKAEEASEHEKRESVRNEANQGTPEEQIEKYTNKWLALWKECQIKGRDSDDMISTPGAIPLKKWQDYLKDRVGTVDMYEVEAVLQMMEELSVNGDTHKALEIFDELQVSITDLDRICHDVMEYKPTIPMQAPDKDQRNNAILEFSRRANKTARQERLTFRQDNATKNRINIESAVRSAVTSDMTPQSENIGREALSADRTKESEDIIYD